MEKITELERVNALVAAHFKRGVRVNAAISAQDYRREMAAGRLFAHEWVGGLALFYERDGFRRMSYYLNEFTEPRDFPEGKTVCEIVLRERDEAQDTLDFWRGLGFETAFERLRLRRRAAPSAACVLDIRPGQAHEVRRLLSDCFDAVTGCLPTEEELETGLEAGEYICCFEEESLAGVLHITDAKRAEIRHLAVRAGLRGRGLAKKLINSAQALNEKDCTVWVLRDNAAAMAVYGSCGFEPDGYRSYVLIKD